MADENVNITKVKMAPHDASFLAKCEQFLLHPTVRALSLAQRVDFLEKKGLSPEEITACLKNIERQNGLSQMLASSAPAAHAAADEATSAAQITLWSLTKRYSVAAVATVLLAYGYVWLRHAMVLKLVAAHRAAAAKRTQRRRATVMDMLMTLTDQRKQYEQVVERVKSRVSRVQQLREAESAPVKKEPQPLRDQELRVLQEQVATLRSAVVDSYKASIEAQVEETAKQNMLAAQASAAPPPRTPHPDLATPEELMDQKPVAPLALQPVVM